MQYGILPQEKHYVLFHSMKTVSIEIIAGSICILNVYNFPYFIIFLYDSGKKHGI